MCGFSNSSSAAWLERFELAGLATAHLKTDVAHVMPVRSAFRLLKTAVGIFAVGFPTFIFTALPLPHFTGKILRGYLISFPQNAFWSGEEDGDDISESSRSSTR